MSLADWTEKVPKEELAPYANNNPLQAFIKECSNAQGVIYPNKLREIANAAGLEHSDPKTSVSILLLEAGLIFRDADPSMHARFHSTPQGERTRDVASAAAPVAVAPVAKAQKAKAAGGGATKPKAAGGGTKDQPPKDDLQIRGVLALLEKAANDHPNPRDALAILTKALALLEKR